MVTGRNGCYQYSRHSGTRRRRRDSYGKSSGSSTNGNRSSSRIVRLVILVVKVVALVTESVVEGEVGFVQKCFKVLDLNLKYRNVV